MLRLKFNDTAFPLASKLKPSIPPSVFDLKTRFLRSLPTFTQSWSGSRLCRFTSPNVPSMMWTSPSKLCGLPAVVQTTFHHPFSPFQTA